MLKSWLYRTLAAALELKMPTITEELWKKHTEAPGTLNSMFDEIRRGEDDFWGQKDERQLKELREKLRIVRKPNKESKKTTQSTQKESGPTPPSQSDPPANKDSTPPPQTQRASSTEEDPPAPLVKPAPTSKRNKKHIGLPNPVRRPVGQEEPRAG